MDGRGARARRGTGGFKLLSPPAHFGTPLSVAARRRGAHRPRAPAVRPQVYSRLLASLSDPSAAPGSSQQLPAVALSGAGAGVALSFILGPTELLKCRLQTTGQHLGPAAVLRQVLREEGLAGLGRGLGATLIREVRGVGGLLTGMPVPWLGMPHACAM
jgi:hypothetical protein